MVGDIFLNFTRDKALIASVRDAEGQDAVEVVFDNGSRENVGLVIRLSKKQTAKVRAALEKY